MSAPSVCDQIRVQMNLTAALMSDPTILRYHPELVADSFAAALRKVEQLQVFLPKNSKGDQPSPFDASIINEGVKKLVYLTMDKQMEPLKEPLPAIVQKEFKQVIKDPEQITKGENLAAREIKETNCLAAVVLVYYYLYWHVLLIKWNQVFFHQYFNDMDKCIDDLLKTLPSERDLLEFRLVNRYFVNRPASETHQPSKRWEELKPYSLNVFPTVTGDKYHVNKTTLAARMYQLTIERLFNRPSAEAPCVPNTFRDTAQQVQSEFITLTSQVSGGIFSTMHFEDETQMWKDMKLVTEVIASSPSGDEQVRYSTTLQRILSQPPYFKTKQEFAEKCLKLCIFHYTSLPLMTDVCDALLTLQTIVKNPTNQIPENIISLANQLANVTKPEGYDTTIKSEIATLSEASKAKTGYESFIMETPNHARVKQNQKTQKFIMVDDVRGYYLGKGRVNMDKANHVFVCSPTRFEVDEPGFLPRLQKLLAKKDDKSVDSLIAPHIRNSFIVLLQDKSIRQIIAKMKSHEALGSMRPQLNDALAPLDLKESQYKEVCERFSKAGRGKYPKYGGVSWPVTYVDDQGDETTNHVCFDEEGVVPRAFLGTQLELVEGVYDLNKTAKAYLNANHGATRLTFGGGYGRTSSRASTVSGESTRPSPASAGPFRAGTTGIAAADAADDDGKSA